MNDKQTLALLKKCHTATRGGTLPIISGMIKKDGYIWFTDLDVTIRLPDTLPHLPDGGYGDNGTKLALADLKVKPEYTDPDEIPFLPDEYEADHDVPEAFWDSVRAVTPACSNDETRHVLMAPAYDKGNIVATDGRRLHVVHGEDFMPQYGGKDETCKGRNIGKPTKLWAAFLSVADMGSIAVTKEHTQYMCGEIVCTIRTPDGTYPNWKQVMPKVDAEWVEMTLPLKEMEKYEKAVGKKSEAYLRFKDGKFTMKGDNYPEAEAGDAPAGLSGQLRIAYLLDCHAFTGLDAVMFKDKDAPVYMKEGNREAILMPMRYE